jgi:hypothetical protein
MPLNVADRVRDTTTTTGTGTITLSGTPPTGYQSFSAVGNGNTTYYTINGGSQWEVGIGTYLGAGPTLSRDTVLASSSGGSLVDFAAGTKDVFCDYPAGKSISDGFGLLPPANGGTGLTSPGTTGNVLTSNGTAWVSQLPSAGGITYTTVKTSNYTASANDGVQTDTSGGAFTVTLPATPAVGAQVIVIDTSGSWATNNLTVGRNGSTIEGSALDLVCNISSVSVQLVYSGTTWNVFAQVGGAGAGIVSVAGGGTGASTLTGYVKGSGTSPLTGVATIPVADGGTGATTAAGARTNLGAAASGANTDITALDQDVTITATGTIAATSIGYRGLPQNQQVSTYTLTLDDIGDHVYTTAGAFTITIPANATTAFPIGSAITIINEDAIKTLAPAGGVTLVLAGTGAATTGNRTLAIGSVATIIKVGTNRWFISGAGVT